MSEYQYKPNFIFFDWGKVVFKTEQEKGIWKTAKNNFELYASFILEWTGEEESDEFFFTNLIFINHTNLKIKNI